MTFGSRSALGHGGRGQAQAPASSVVRLLRRRFPVPAGAGRSQRRRAARPAGRASRATASGCAIRPASSSRSRSRPRPRPPTRRAAPGRRRPEGVAGAPVRRNAPVVRPRRLSHVLVFTTDVDQAVDFYTRNLGLRLSDHSDVVAFMHAVHGSDHHILAFAQSSASGMHHCSWDTKSIDDIGVGAMTMAAQGPRQRMGPRPPRARFELLPLRAGSVGQLCRIFLRHRLHPARPSSGTPDTTRRRNSFYLWGPEPPADFTFNREAQA